MIIKSIQRKDELNRFVASQKYSQFLCSWSWLSFARSIGRETRVFGVFDQREMVAAALLERRPLPFGRSYLYAPRNPVMSDSLDAAGINSAYQLIFKKARELAHGERATFFRMEPLWDIPVTLRSAAIIPVVPIQPQDTLILDLSADEDGLLAQMHQKTRYNIRLAGRKGVTVEDAGAEQLDEFIDLVGSMSGRQGISPHPEDYYKKLFSAFQNQDDNRSKLSDTRPMIPMARLKRARYQGETLASNLAVYFGDTVTYLHGASSEEHRKVMAPHLLQWETAREARKLGYRYYDFWGIAPADSAKNKAWAGITRFKRGFGGKAVHFAGAFDMVFDKTWYKLYKLAKKIRK